MMRNLPNKKILILVLFIVLVILLVIPKDIVANSISRGFKPTAAIKKGVMTLNGPYWECVCPESSWDCYCKVPEK